MSASPGRIHAILDKLVDERRRLEATRGEAALLEANKRAIVYWRAQLVEDERLHGLRRS